MNDHAPTTDLAAELMRARHDVLTVRDHVIGLEAENARLQAELAGARRRIERLRKRATSAEARVRDLQSSRTWRVGRAFVSPASVFRRRGR